MTELQSKALAFVRDHIAVTGFSPTLAEIAVAIGVVGKSQAHRVVEQLVDQGRLVRSSNRNRSLEPAPEPAGLAAYPTEALRAELARRMEALPHG